MPDTTTRDTTTGALVNGFEAAQLSAKEFNQLKTTLRLLRRDDDWVGDFTTMWLMMNNFDRDPTKSDVARRLIDGLNEDEKEGPCCDSILSDGHGITGLDEQEFARLALYVKVIRAGGWLAKWLDVQIHSAAGGEPITPLLAMQALMMEVEEFEAQAETAQEFAARWPHLMKLESAGDSTSLSSPAKDKPAFIKEPASAIADEPQGREGSGYPVPEPAA